MFSIRQVGDHISRFSVPPGARKTIYDAWRSTAWRTASTDSSAGTLSQSTLNSKIVPLDSNAKVNKSMRAYLERAQAHSMFMKQQSQEFEIGRRHLANMMGEDPETFTQQDIDRAIHYLLPSNLFSRKAIPLMKPPVEIFPQQKDAQFGLDGRPFHPFFFTGRPNYYQVLHDIVEWTQQLNVLEDERVMKGRAPPDKKLNLAGTQWMKEDELVHLLMENISTIDYEKFVLAMEKLLQHPYVYRVEEFIRKYRKVLKAENMDIKPPTLKKDEAGRSYSEAYAGRKSAHAWVTLKEGSGQVEINGQDILFFPRASDRIQVMFPLQILDKLFKFDLTVKVDFGGYSSQAGAIREGLAKCLTAFVSKEDMEILRHAGLLTHDIRVKERKKYAYTGARSKPTWRKR